MQPQRKHARNSIVSNAISRRRLHDNIIQWRQQAGARPVARKPLIGKRTENVILTLVGIAACLIARSAGVL